jgi:four helix bundle protein
VGVRKAWSVNHYRANGKKLSRSGSVAAWVGFSRDNLCYTAQFPKSEIFGLSAQMRRAAVSIPSNIAKGQARSSSKEFLHFLSISLGSLAELSTQIELAGRLGYMEGQAALAQTELLGKKLHCLRTSIRDRLPTTNNQ